MYIETALKRLNAFHQDVRCDERFSFPTTYMDEPYALYSWGEILQLATCYPHVTDTDDVHPGVGSVVYMNPLDVIPGRTGPRVSRIGLAQGGESFLERVDCIGAAELVAHGFDESMVGFLEGIHR